MYKCKFRWPNDAKIAVVFNMSWESWDDTLGTGKDKERGSPNIPATSPYTRGMRWVFEHSYGDHGGLLRLLDVWDRHKIKSSCYADGLTVKLFPGLAKEVREGGHEFIVQGWDHSALWAQTVEQQAASIDNTIEVFKKQGITFTGFSSSGGNVTYETFPMAAERGFKYVCGLRNCDVPFIIPVGKKKLVGMTSYDLSDFGTAGGRTTTPRQMLGMWRDYFDGLYAEGERGYPKMIAYGTHPFVSHPHRTQPLEEVISYVKSKPGVWFATRGEIAQWMLDEYPDYDLSKFYPEAAQSDRYYGLGIGLGGAQGDAKHKSYRQR